MGIGLVQKILEASRPPRVETSIIAIDGCGGAGKSTLAKLLSQKIDDCPIIHTDDFASWDNPFGWYERLITQVLRPLSENKSAKFQRFDWGAQTLAEWITVGPAPFVILEGVVSARREFRPFLTFSIFIQTDRELRLNRGLSRDGMAMKDKWLSWMQKEDIHHADHRTIEAVDEIISGEFACEIS